MQTTLEAARRQIAYSQTGGSLERIVQRTERALLQEGSSGILSPASPSRIRLVSLDRRLGFLGRGTLRPRPFVQAQSVAGEISPPMLSDSHRAMFCLLIL